jgi:hypothetical protein
VSTELNEEEVSSGRVYLDYNSGNTSVHPNVTSTAVTKPFARMKPNAPVNVSASKERSSSGGSNQPPSTMNRKPQVPSTTGRKAHNCTAIRQPQSNGCERGTPESMLISSGGQIVAGVRTVDVVLRPSLARSLRPHQQDGLLFLVSQ